jgi:hypothetical protein
MEIHFLKKLAWGTMIVCTVGYQGQSVGGIWSGQKVFHWHNWKFKTLLNILIDLSFQLTKKQVAILKTLSTLTMDSLLRVCQSW